MTLAAAALGRVGDERTAALKDDEPSLCGEFFFGPADYVSAHAVLVCHIQFARQAVVHGQDVRTDVAEHVVIDLLPKQPWCTVADAVSLVWQ
jgi:hypothetical protein